MSVSPTRGYWKRSVADWSVKWPPPYFTRLICEEVYLARYRLAVYSEDRALRLGEKVDGTWLHGVRRKVYLWCGKGHWTLLVTVCYCIIRINLVCIVKTVVHFDGIGVGRNVTGRRRERERSMSLKVCFDRPGALLTESCIETSLNLHDSEVFLCRENSRWFLFLWEVSRSMNHWLVFRHCQQRSVIGLLMEVATARDGWRLSTLQHVLRSEQDARTDTRELGWTRLRTESFRAPTCRVDRSTVALSSMLICLSSSAT